MSIIYFRKSPNEAWATIPAIKGADGHTPIKGVDYFTEEEIEAIKADIQLPEVDLSKYALKTDIPDTSSFITIGDVEAKGYQTEAQVLAAINEALGVIENGTY